MDGTSGGIEECRSALDVCRTLAKPVPHKDKVQRTAHGVCLLQRGTGRHSATQEGVLGPTLVGSLETFGRAGGGVRRPAPIESGRHTECACYNGALAETVPAGARD